MADGASVFLDGVLDRFDGQFGLGVFRSESGEFVPGSGEGDSSVDGDEDDGRIGVEPVSRLVEQSIEHPTFGAGVQRALPKSHNVSMTMNTHHSRR